MLNTMNVNKNELLKIIQELNDKYPMPTLDEGTSYTSDVKETIVKGWLRLALEKEYLVPTEFDLLDKLLDKAFVFDKILTIDKFRDAGVTSYKIYD